MWYNLVMARGQGFTNLKSNPQWVTVQWSVLTVRSHSTDAVFGVIKYIITEITIILFYKWRIVCHRLVLFTYIDISITYPVVNLICFHLNHYLNILCLQLSLPIFLFVYAFNIASNSKLVSAIFNIQDNEWSLKEHTEKIWCYDHFAIIVQSLIVFIDQR